MDHADVAPGEGDLAELLASIDTDATRAPPRGSVVLVGAGPGDPIYSP